IFDEPVRLALAADDRVSRSRSVLRVSVVAAPTTGRQQAELLEIERTVSGGLGLRDLPRGRVGLFLGDRWIPAGADPLGLVPVGRVTAKRRLPVGRRASH